jgi:hypothetical protein
VSASSESIARGAARQPPAPTTRRDRQGRWPAAPPALPANLADATWDYGSTDGNLGVITTAPATTWGYAERLKDADIWNIVNYIRSLGARK